MKSSRLLDASAIGLSGLCLVHCLALPLVLAALPMLGAWAQSEWIHAVFISVAAPISAFALWRNSHAGARPLGLILAAATGLVLLGLGVIDVDGLERPLTVAGSLTLAATHLWNWALHRRRHETLNHACDRPH